MNWKNFHPERFGKWLIIAGFIGFVTSVILSLTKYSGYDQGAIPAASFFSVMIGIAFHFPSLLQDPQGGLSTMRIIVFMVTLVFSIIYIKIGWSVTNFDEFKIDSTWIYILGLAFGSKAFQRMTEEEEVKGDKKGDKQ